MTGGSLLHTPRKRRKCRRRERSAGLASPGVGRVSRNCHSRCNKRYGRMVNETVLKIMQMRRKEGDKIMWGAVLWSGSGAGGSVINRLFGSGCAGRIST